MTNIGLTYLDLEAALTQLGFIRRELDNAYILYVNKSQNALITLPLVDPCDPVLSTHLLTARRLVVERGIADASTFDSLLYQLRIGHDQENSGLLALTAVKA